MWERRWGGPVLCHSWESCSDLDTDLGTGTSRSCHHVQAVPLVTSSAAGSSVGSLRVAGLISRIHLRRKMGKPDCVGTREARGPRESALQKAKGQESIGDLTGATADLSQQQLQSCQNLCSAVGLSQLSNNQQENAPGVPIWQ